MSFWPPRGTRRTVLMLLTANMARGTILSQLGDFDAAAQHLDRALAVFDLRQALPTGLEVNRLASFHTLYISLHCLGYPDRAWVRIATRCVDTASRGHSANDKQIRLCVEFQNRSGTGNGRPSLVPGELGRCRFKSGIREN
jgi:hypothetical protein